MPTLESINGYATNPIDVGLTKKSRKRRRCYMPKGIKLPRTEAEVLDTIVDWCKDRHPRVEVQKAEYEKLIEKTGKKKIIDATLIGKYKRRSRSGAKGCLIAELEFEEHKSKKYSILGDMTEITALLRKLDYWRNDIPQYWIKIDRDGTPFMINYREIYDRRRELNKMHPTDKWHEHDQIMRIKAASRETKKDKWPKHVIIGWDDIFKRLHKTVKLAGF